MRPDRDWILIEIRQKSSKIMASTYLDIAATIGLDSGQNPTVIQSDSESSPTTAELWSKFNRITVASGRDAGGCNSPKFWL